MAKQSNQETRLKELQGMTVEEVAAIAVKAETERDAAIAENDQLQNQLEEANTGKSKAEAERDAALELNDELQEKAEAAKEGKPLTVKVGSKKYRVAIPSFLYKGAKTTAEQLVNDPKLCENLVKEGSGVLELIEED